MVVARVVYVVEVSRGIVGVDGFRDGKIIM